MKVFIFSKIISLIFESPIMDPRINLPSDCMEEIFRHLGGDDLLKCTLVCPQWNEFIGRTRSCMKKIFIFHLSLNV